jgi:hypothetical protein
MSRNNVSDHFEACYLKENQARKAFANTEAISVLLASPDFDRCTKYMANLVFSQNESVLLAHGFNYDDVLSVVRTLGLQLVNSKFKPRTPKDLSYILMRHVEQRINTFFLFLDRKFKFTENYLDVHTGDAALNGERAGRRMIGDFPAPLPIDDEDEVIPVRKIDKTRKTKTNAMRKELNDNIEKYRDKLAYLATSKVVDFEVRKKARKLCRKHNIEYVAWAKERIASGRLSEVDFVLV